MNLAPVILALESQLACYQTLAKLAGQQHEYVRQGRTEALLEVLSSRQGLLDELARLEAVITPVRRTWPAVAADLPAEQRQRAESLFLETRALLEEITQADQNDVLVLQQRKINIGRQIGSASASQNVNRAYAAAAYGRPAPRMNVQQ